jgi:RimJ/RimL family protein N-acetyltransferase
MQLKVLSYPDVEQARIWRNDSMSMNRTPFLLTQEMQGRFYQEQVCNRQANARYWGIFEHEHKEYPDNELVCDYDTFIGMGEITNISLENRLGEIGLIMHPEHLDKADKAIELILEQGFNNLNLENIFGECYYCSSYINIWEIACKKYNGIDASLPNRKFWNGKYYSSLYFNINREAWKHGREGI